MGRLLQTWNFYKRQGQLFKILVYILPIVNNDPEFVQGVPLLRSFFSLKKSGFHNVFYFLSKPLINISSLLLRKGFEACGYLIFLKYLFS